MSLEVEFVDALSMKYCATHSPNVQPLRERPAAPNTCSIICCLNAQFAVLFEGEVASQDISSAPESVLSTPERSVSGVLPQKVEFAKQWH